MIELAGFLVFLAILVLLGVIADHWDPYNERADARRRNGR